MAECWSSSGPIDCVLGLRDANHGSGVGLFNEQLARRLGVRHERLARGLPVARHPLLSLKFEELTSEQRRSLARLAAGGRPFSLFLHTLDESPEETALVAAAEHLFCGNDWIAARLQRRLGDRPLVRAFAPSLIEAPPAARARPAVELFSFGMAGKVDFARFARLAEMLGEAQIDYRLSCSLAVHQTSDGGCLGRAVDFLAECFGDRFLHLGTLTDAGVACFLTDRVFVGFYRDGVRSNNTTFHTALAHGCRIITNLDAHSPPQLGDCESVFDLDARSSEELARFLLQAGNPESATQVAADFSWDRLLALVLAESGRISRGGAGTRAA